MGEGVGSLDESLDAGFVPTGVGEKQLKLTRGLVVVGRC